MPKNLYLKEGELEKEACTITEDSIYQSVTLTKGQVIYTSIYSYIYAEDSPSMLTFISYSLLIMIFTNSNYWNLYILIIFSNIYIINVI